MESSDLPDQSARLSTLDACIARSQQTIAAATGPEMSAGDLAPANSSLADAQDAAEEGKKLTAQGKEREATALVRKALEDCNKIDGMVAKARQEAATRKSRVQATAQVETRMMQITPCLDRTRQTLRGAGVGKKRPDYGPAATALGKAEQSVRDARVLLSKGDTSGAMMLLDTADADCRQAQDIIAQAGPLPPTPTSTSRRKRR
jgi:hypothetical protein